MDGVLSKKGRRRVELFLFDVRSQLELAGNDPSQEEVEKEATRIIRENRASFYSAITARRIEYLDEFKKKLRKDPNCEEKIRRAEEMISYFDPFIPIPFGEYLPQHFNTLGWNCAVKCRITTGIIPEKKDLNSTNKKYFSQGWNWAVDEMVAEMKKTRNECII